MALAGIGSLPPSPLLRASGNAADLADQDRLHAAGAVGDVCQRFFDSAGNLVPSDLDDRVVGIDADTLRKIPRRIGIAGGESKHKAIHAAVSGGWVNVLITDTGTAAALLQARDRGTGPIGQNRQNAAYPNRRASRRRDQDRRCPRLLAHSIGSFPRHPFRSSRPTGDHRFLAPVPVRPWGGIRDALRYGPTPQRKALSRDHHYPGAEHSG